MYGSPHQITVGQHQLVVGQAVEWLDAGRLAVGQLSSIVPGAYGGHAEVLAGNGFGGITTRLVTLASLAPAGTAARAAAPSPDWLDAATNQYINRANGHGRARTAPFVPTGDAAYDQAALWAIRRNGKPGR